MHGKKFFIISFAFLFGIFSATFLFLNLGDISFSVHQDEIITIRFNKEINLVSSISIDPIIKSEIRTKGLFGVKEIRIIPEEDVPKGEDLNINFEYKKIFGSEVFNFSSVVQLPISTDIKSFNISEENGLISTKPKIILEVNQEEGHEYSVKVFEHPIVWEKNDLLGSIGFTPSESLPLNINVTLALYDKDQIIFKRNFITSDEPRIIEITQKDYLLDGEKIDIYFNKAIDLNSKPLNITAPGEGNWQTETYYSFILGDLEPGSQYLFELQKGAKSKDGGVVFDTQSFVISAPGELEGLMSYDEENSQIKVEFNQPVDKSDVEFKFLTVPKIKGTFSWQDNTLFFNIDNLSYETKYSITIPREVKVPYGISNKKSFNLSFQTDPYPHKNQIPLAKTKYEKGGSLASVVSVLEYFKIKSTEETILQKMGQDIPERQSGVWGDPRKVFVGPYDKSTGYGVHASVLARVISGYGKSATVLTNPSISTISKEVFAGKAVLIVTVDGADFWQTKDGVSIKAGKNLKVQIISGVYGKSSIKGFFLHDAQTGEKYKYITASTLTSILKTVPGVTDQVVVVK